MRKIFILLLLFVCAKAYAQPYPSEQPLGHPNTMYTQKGAIRGLKGLQLPNYPDTATANLGYIKAYAGAAIYTTIDSNVWIRNSDTTRWMLFGAGGGIGCGDSSYVDASLLPDSTGFELIRCNGVRDTIPFGSNGGSTIDTTGQFVTSAFQRGDSLFYVKNGMEVLLGVIEVTTIDTSLVRFTVDTVLNAIIFYNNFNITDTVFFVSSGGGGGSGTFDTTAIYAAIALKLNISDTSAMLSNYLNFSDTSSMLSGYVKYTDTAIMLINYVNFSDTSAMLSNYVNFNDTATMLLPYLQISDTTGKFYSNITQPNDSTWRFHKGDTYYDLIVPQSGGSVTPDTIITKPPIYVDTTGVKDTLEIKLLPETFLVNDSPTDTTLRNATYKKIGWTTLADTVRFTAGTLPSGTPEIIYRYKIMDEEVHLWIKAYYPTNGVTVSVASINLPSVLPLPDVPTGYTAAQSILYKGVGGMYVNRTRTDTDLPTSNAECLMRVNAAADGYELTIKMGTGSYRLFEYFFIYPKAN